MQHPRTTWIVIFFCVLLAGGVTAQSPPAAPVLLSVTGGVEKPLRLSATELSEGPRRTVRAKGHDGKESEFEGVALVEIYVVE